MSNFDILKNLMDAQQDTGTQAYDTTATVRRIEGSTAWVHIPGGVDETPVRLTINAKAGDTVQLRVGGGSAWIVGNQTAPPTDDTKAEAAQGTAETAHVIATKASTVATSAKKIADNTNQYFWMVSEGTDTGAHITEVTREEFLEDPDNGGGNLLARSNGIAIRDGLTELARFGADVQIGAGFTGYTVIDSNGMRVYRGGSQLANIGYGEGNVYSGGTENAPYYTLGNRVLAAPNYSASKTYLIGEKVYYNNDMYACIHQITTAEPWNSSHWLKVEDVQIGAYSMAEGYHTAALRQSDHAEGRETFAQGNYAHAEGFFTVAGTATTQTALAAHAEGMHTAALDVAAHAEGRETIASGGSSHAQNRGTIAAGARQTALGSYNIEDTNNTYAVIVGNGTADDARSNALTVDWDGNVQAAGQVKSATETCSLTLPSTVSFGGGLVRNGGIAMLSIINISKLPAGETTICTLPEGWRPPISVMSRFEAPDSSAGPVRLFINSSGVVTLYNYGSAISSASNISDTITYVLA